MEAFLDDGEGFIGRLLSENTEEHISNKREVGQEVGVSASRSILTHNGVPAPVITDLDASPVSANQIQPLTGSVLIRQSTG